VDLGDAKRQKSRQLELPLEDRGEAPKVDGGGEAPTAARGDERSGTDDALMERVVERSNVVAALKRVQKNKGSPGIDGMTVEALRDHLRETWPVLREQLLAGTYRPQPVKRQLIPKSDGGERELGIPTALDRFIQQALLQVLQPQFDPTFSQHSHGFRPGRRAHDAVCSDSSAATSAPASWRTGSWWSGTRGAGTRLSGTPTTATCTCGHGALASA